MSTINLLILAGIPALPLLVAVVALLVSRSRRESAEGGRVSVLRAMFRFLVGAAVVYSAAQAVWLVQSRFQSLTMALLPLVILTASAAAAHWQMKTLARQEAHLLRPVRSSR